MEEKSRLSLILITAIAPVAWGSTCFVTQAFLPASHPLWGGLLRALPAGLLLLAWTRRLPRGSWWWRAAVLGTLNVGGFFVLIYIASTRLPSSIASSLMSTSALAMLLFAWVLLGSRPRLVSVTGGVVGVVGVVLMTGGDARAIDPFGIAASLGAMTASSVGFVLTTRWGGDIPPVRMAAWQLMAGGALLLPVALLVEGPPPPVSPSSALAFGYAAAVATALAYAAWFTGLKRLSPGVVGIVGLLNPVTGVALGVLLAGEAFGVPQAAGFVLVLAGLGLGLARRPAAAPTRGARGSSPAAPGSRRPARPEPRHPLRSRGRSAEPAACPAPRPTGRTS